MKSRVFSVVVAAVVPVVGVVSAATLERLSIEEMSQKATAIVRGRVSRCAGEMNGSIIYTRCTVNVTERWKGDTPARTDFLIPGGTANGLVQTFTGAPKFTGGDEYILFLWSGQSGVFQIIGLSQGKFDLKATSKGVATARREASGERMIDKSGNEVKEEPVEIQAAELRARVQRALSGASK